MALIPPAKTSAFYKEKEEKIYGEYHTRHLVLEVWDTMEKSHH
jgi:hypothetical protein